MSAYIFVNVEEVSDPESMVDYATHVPAIIQAFDGEYLVRGEESTVVEGSWQPGFVVLIRFPSVERAYECYDSDLYRPFRELRERAARTSVVILPEAA